MIYANEIDDSSTKITTKNKDSAIEQHIMPYTYTHSGVTKITILMLMFNMHSIILHRVHHSPLQPIATAFATMLVDRESFQQRNRRRYYHLCQAYHGCPCEE